MTGPSGTVELIDAAEIACWTTALLNSMSTIDAGRVLVDAEKVFDGTELTLSKDSVAPVILDTSAAVAHERPCLEGEEHTQ